LLARHRAIIQIGLDGTAISLHPIPLSRAPSEPAIVLTVEAVEASVEVD